MWLWRRLLLLPLLPLLLLSAVCCLPKPHAPSPRVALPAPVPTPLSLSKTSPAEIIGYQTATSALPIVGLRHNEGEHGKHDSLQRTDILAESNLEKLLPAILKLNVVAEAYRSSVPL